MLPTFAGPSCYQSLNETLSARTHISAGWLLLGARTPCASAAGAPLAPVLCVLPAGHAAIGRFVRIGGSWRPILPGLT